MQKNLTLCLLLTMVVVSCNSTEYHQLNKHYFYINQGANGRRIYSDNAVSKNLICPDIIDYNSDDSFIIARQNPNLNKYKYCLEGNLYARYVGYAEYLRNPELVNTHLGSLMKNVIENDSVNYGLFVRRGIGEQNTRQDNDMGLAIVDSLLKYDSYYRKIVTSSENYWIINLSKDTMLGPLSKAEYLKERQLLNISNSLKLKDD